MRHLHLTSIVLLFLIPFRGGSAPLLRYEGHRFLNFGSRGTLQIYLKNLTGSTVAINGLELNGVPVEELASKMTDKGHRLSDYIDWWDIRPNPVPSERIVTVRLGYISLKEYLPGFTLSVKTERSKEDFQITPEESPLVFSFIGFGTSMKKVYAFVRNRDSKPYELRGVSVNLNGEDVSLRTSSTASALQPDETIRLDIQLETPLSTGDSVALILKKDGKMLAGAELTAFPSDFPTWVYNSENGYCNLEDLRSHHIITTVEKIMSPQLHLSINWNTLEPTERDLQRIKRMAEAWRDNPNFWIWYDWDDVAWGRPPPRVILKQRELRRRFGDRHPSFIGNPADNERYADLTDVYMNYCYYVTHRHATPLEASTHGGRSIDMMRRLNEPKPIIYLVDLVGQGLRWITPAEEELVSLRTVGHGAKPIGWFMYPNLWDQGTTMYGGLDIFGDHPRLYQQGANLNPQVWNKVGELATLFKILRPWLSISTPVSIELTEHNIELCTLLSYDNTLLNILINANAYSTYPRDPSQPWLRGGINIIPQHDIHINLPVPRWLKPHRVIKISYNDGPERIRFKRKRDTLLIRLPYLRTGAVVLVLPDDNIEASLIERWESIAKPKQFPPPAQPDFDLESGETEPWWDSSRHYRITVEVKAKKQLTDAFVSASFSPDHLGLMSDFDPASVRMVEVSRDGKFLRKVESYTDFYHWVVFERADISRWKLIGLEPSMFSFQGGFTNLSGKIAERPGYGYAVIPNATATRHYPYVEVRHRGFGTPLLLRWQAEDAEGKEVKGSFRYHRLGGRRNLDGSLTWRSNWVEAIHRDRRNRKHLTPDSVTLQIQYFSGKRCSFRWIRFRRQRALVVFKMPGKTPEGTRRHFQLYFDYTPSARPPDVSRPLPSPSNDVTVKVRETEPYSVALRKVLVRKNSIKVTACTSAVCEKLWAELCQPDGRVLSRSLLTSSDGLQWKGKLSRKRSEGMILRALALDKNGYIETVARQIANHSNGQTAVKELEPLWSVSVGTMIGSIAMDSAGKHIAVGSDKLYFIRDGKILWSRQLEGNITTHSRFLRGVEEVAIAPDGEHIVAKTIGWNPKNRVYNPNFLYLFDSDGELVWKKAIPWSYDQRGWQAWQWGKPWELKLRLTEGGVAFGNRFIDWLGDERKLPRKARYIRRASSPDGDFTAVVTRKGHSIYHHSVKLLDRKGSALWENDAGLYPSRLAVAENGRATLVGTLYGVVTLFDHEGNRKWEKKFISRIDDIKYLPGANAFALGYKRYLFDWDWTAKARMDIYNFEGKLLWRFEAPPRDDWGHYGSALVLAVSADGRFLTLGSYDGWLYFFALPGLVP